MQVLAGARRSLASAERIWVIRKLRLLAEEAGERLLFVEGVSQTLLVVRWTKSYHKWRETTCLLGYRREALRLAVHEHAASRLSLGLDTLRGWAEHR